MQTTRLRISVLAFYLILFHLQSFAWFGARSQGLGGASVALQDQFSAFNNQAGLASLKTLSANLYIENRFLMSELNTRNVGLNIPTNSGCFGFTYSQFGYSNYHETKVALAFGKQLARQLNIGIQTNYRYNYIAEQYPRSGLISIETGLHYTLSEKTVIGVHVANPVTAKTNATNYLKAPIEFKLGCAYTFSPKLLSVLEVHKVQGIQAQLKGGLEYQVNELLILRTGINTHPISNTFGFGLHWDKFLIDFASSYHYILGYSPQLSLIYQR